LLTARRFARFVRSEFATEIIMSIDNFEHYSDQAGNPARHAFAINPHDSTELSITPKALLVGMSGNVVLRAIDSMLDVTITAAAGQIIPIRASFVRSTGTTASQIIGLA
jgi:hypothetical protein